MAEARVAPVHDERRDADRRQHLAHVDLTVHPQQGNRGARARRVPHERAPAPAVILVDRSTGSRDGGVDRVRPVPLERLEASVELLLGHQAGARAREGAVEDERSRPLRIGRREERAQRPAFRDPEQRGPLRAGRVHHGPHVVHPLLEDRQLVHRHPIGEPGAALVEKDQPQERREPAEKGGLERVLPGQLEMSDPAGNEDEVDRPVADHLVGDVNVTALGVTSLRNHKVDPTSRYAAAPAEPDLMEAAGIESAQDFNRYAEPAASAPIVLLLSGA